MNFSYISFGLSTKLLEDVIFIFSVGPEISVLLMHVLMGWLILVIVRLPWLLILFKSSLIIASNASYRRLNVHWIVQLNWLLLPLIWNLLAALNHINLVFLPFIVCLNGASWSINHHLWWIFSYFSLRDWVEILLVFMIFD